MSTTSIASAMLVPPAMVGDPPETRTRVQRACVEFAYSEAFKRRYGVEVPLSIDAIEISARDRLRAMGIL